MTANTLHSASFSVNGNGGTAVNGEQSGSRVIDGMMIRPSPAPLPLLSLDKQLSRSTTRDTDRSAAKIWERSFIHKHSRPSGWSIHSQVYHEKLFKLTHTAHVYFSHDSYHKYSAISSTQHSLIAVNHWSTLCSLWGTDQIFIYNVTIFVSSCSERSITAEMRLQCGDEAALEQLCLRVLRFSSIIITLPMLFIFIS
jgi:hypothetical protein